jgi:hypothetical protein
MIIRLGKRRRSHLAPPGGSHKLLGELYGSSGNSEGTLNTPKYDWNAFSHVLGSSLSQVLK